MFNARRLLPAIALSTALAAGALILVMVVAAAAQATPSAANGIEGSIVFQSNRAGSADIYSIRTDGSSLTRLTSGVAGPNRRPRWSPNGRKIAFGSRRDGNWEIYTMNADGTAQTRLTTNTVLDDYPAWTADGRRRGRLRFS
jgi:dipeptidyl aminopeptidase/acylaminoacyl peptidase